MLKPTIILISNNNNNNGDLCFIRKPEGNHTISLNFKEQLFFFLCEAGALLADCFILEKKRKKIGISSCQQLTVLQLLK
jgi:hypothetical protein